MMSVPAPVHPMPAHVHVLRHVASVLLRAAAVSAVLLLLSLLLAAALDAGAFGVGSAARTGLGRFLSEIQSVAGFGGGLLALALAQVVTYFQHRETRKVLDEVAGSEDAPEIPPVAWQHAALRRVRAGAGMVVVALPVIVFSGFMGAVGIFVANQEPGNRLALGLSIGGPLAVAAGISMIVAGSRRVTGRARDRWGHLPPVDTGSRVVAQDRAQLRGARPALRSLGGLLAARRILPGAAGAVAGVVLLLVSQETSGPALVGIGVLVVLLAAFGVVDVVGDRQLRRALLREAADPSSPAPPALLLRRALRQEVPYQSALGLMLVLALALLVVGVAGVRTGPEYPLGDFQGLFRLAATAGGIGVLFHASGMASKRSRTRDENDYLGRRWDHR